MVWVAVGAVAVWGLIFFLLALVQLDPITFPSEPGDEYPVLRFDPVALPLAQAASSFALDIVVLCLPLPLIARLQMDRRRKMAVAGIFWLGAFCVITAIVRTVSLAQPIEPTWTIPQRESTVL